MLGPLLGLMVGHRLKDHWNSLEHVKHIDLPALYLSGERDELVPPLMMSALFDAHGRHSAAHTWGL